MSKEKLFGQSHKNLYFDDPFELAQFALANFPDECAEAISTADDVAAQRFKFNLRWDMERTWEYITFEDEIDWLHQPGNDPEWIFAFNRMAFWVTLGQAYALTKDEKYAEAFVKQMVGWVKTVPRTNESAWRSIEVGLRLDYWLKAVQYFKDSPAITDEVAEIFIGSIIDHCEFLMGIWNHYNLMSNWGVLANHGLFMAGVMLPETDRSKEYAKESARRLSLELQMQVYRDGTHWEQSPMYHNEVLKCYLDVVVLAKRNNITLAENMERQVKDMCYFSMYSAKPDHHEICMGDSDNVDQRDLLTRGAAHYQDAFLKSRGYDVPDFDSLWDIGMDDLNEYAKLKSELPPCTDKAFFDSNNFYMRSSWDDEATFTHFHCGTLGAGHGHSDKLHVDIFSRGEDVLVDAGRYTYVFGEDRVKYKETKAHNVLMADDKDIYVCMDSWECSDLTRGINQRFFSNEKYGYTEGGHLGYYSSGIYMNRRVIYLKPDIIVLVDELYAAGDHKYNQFFHFNNAGELSGSADKYVYKSQNVKAKMHVIGNDISSCTETSYISRHYNREDESKMVTTSFSGSGFTSVFTVFALSDADVDKELVVTKHPVTSTFKSRVFEDKQIEAITIKFGDEHYTISVAHEEYATPTDTFNTDGCVGFGNCVVFDRSAGETEIGTVLLW